jgi:ribonuclease P/MRP protein subunit RPP40
VLGEKVQRRAVGMIAGLKSRDYSERLKELGLTTMEERRHQ